MRQAVFAISFSLVLAAAAGAFAQTDAGSPFLRPEPATPPPCDLQFPSRLPVRCWVGQEFVVLPLDPRLRRDGYPSIYTSEARGGHTSYDELAGKTVTVMSVAWHDAATRSDISTWIVGFRDAASGRGYGTCAVLQPTDPPDDAIVDTLVLLRDLKAARSQYLGKTYWIQAASLPRLGANGEMTVSGIVKYRRFAPATVSDVLAGGNPSAPVRIVVKNAAGEEGYFDMAASATNLPRSASTDIGDAAFAKVMASSDPRLAHKWPAKIWDALENQTIAIGMSMEQVRMSWGEPRSIKRSVHGRHAHERWDYAAANAVYFDDGTVSEIQN